MAQEGGEGGWIRRSTSKESQTLSLCPMIGMRECVASVGLDGEDGLKRETLNIALRWIGFPIEWGV